MLLGEQTVEVISVTNRVRPFTPPGLEATSGKERGPCVRNCCLDDKDVCLGCGRTLKEITAWSGMSEEQRKSVLELAESRLKERRW